MLAYGRANTVTLPAAGGVGQNAEVLGHILLPLERVGDNAAVVRRASLEAIDLGAILGLRSENSPVSGR
jgi:hypothetical protein